MTDRVIKPKYCSAERMERNVCSQKRLADRRGGDSRRDDDEEEEGDEEERSKFRADLAPADGVEDWGRRRGAPALDELDVILLSCGEGA